MKSFACFGVLALIVAGAMAGCAKGEDTEGAAGSPHATGGTDAGADTGGSATGGAGGANTGGANMGGQNTGGANTGGANTGGSNTGGASTGGASTGGAANTGGSSNTGGNSNTGGAANTGGSSTGGAANTGGSSTGGSAPYAHTVNIDGTLDFNDDEKFVTTSSPSYTGYVSWDATYVYVAMVGPDIAANDPQRWVLVYIGGTPGTPTGQAYNLQEPKLPFLARYHFRWKTSNDYTNAQLYSGTTWTIDPSWTFTGDVYRAGTTLEMRFLRSKLGSPTKLSIHLSMLNEKTGSEWTYAGVPSTSFVDKADPDYLKYFEFDLNSAKKPATYSPLP